MAYQDISPISKRLLVLIGLGVVSAMAFGLAVSFYRNVLFDDTLRALSGQNATIRRGIDEDLRTLEYYRSRQYRDKYAKEQLGKLNAGENMLVITERSSSFSYEPLDEPSSSVRRTAAYQEYLQQLPTLEHWRLYLFDQALLTQIKKSF